VNAEFSRRGGREKEGRELPCFLDNHLELGKVASLFAARKEEGGKRRRRNIGKGIAISGRKKKKNKGLLS